MSAAVITWEVDVAALIAETPWALHSSAKGSTSSRGIAVRVLASAGVEGAATTYEGRERREATGVSMPIAWVHAETRGGYAVGAPFTGAPTTVMEDRGVGQTHEGPFVHIAIEGSLSSEVESAASEVESVIGQSVYSQEPDLNAVSLGMTSRTRVRSSMRGTGKIRRSVGMRRRPLARTSVGLEIGPSGPRPGHLESVFVP